MRASVFVGRVGGLAVALGIGVAVGGLASGVAGASPDGSTESSARGEATAAGATRDGSSGSGSRSRVGRSAAQEPSSGGRDSGGVKGALGGSGKSHSDGDTVIARVESDGLAAALPVEAVRPAVRVSTAVFGDRLVRPAGSVPVEVIPVIPTVVGLVPGVGEASVMAPAVVAAGTVEAVDGGWSGTVPGGPVEATVSWVMLAAARRETGSGPRVHGRPAGRATTGRLLDIEQVAGAAATVAGEDPVEALALAAAAASVDPITAFVEQVQAVIGGIVEAVTQFVNQVVTVVNQIVTAMVNIFVPATPVSSAPTVTALTVGVPDSVTGAVIGTVSATDADGDVLTYTALAQTGKGTVVIDAGTGSFTYTPTVAARQNAAKAEATPADKADSFTVTVADGKGGSVTVTVTVTVLAASVPTLKPTSQAYTTFGGDVLNLFMYKGSKTAILANSDSLDPTAMSKWLNAMDGTYDFYELATGREPTFYTNVTYFDGRSTIARVDATCGAGCGYVGWTGIEIMGTYFDYFYEQLLNRNRYDQVPFYEFGRNFWFYSDKLEYKDNGPVGTGYAVFMRFAAIDYLGLDGAPYNGWLPYTEFESQIRGLRAQYLSDPSLNWSNTLGIGQGVPQSAWGAADLFTSFCFYLQDTYGTQWVLDVWKEAAVRPDATTTQDAVDNFVIAASLAANSNLAPLFDYWRWPVSQNAINELQALKLKSTWENT